MVMTSILHALILQNEQGRIHSDLGHVRVGNEKGQWRRRSFKHFGRSDAKETRKSTDITNGPTSRRTDSNVTQ